MTKQLILKAPFPYFGGKSKIISEVWKRFGKVSNFVDPFCGSAAAIIGRPLPFSGSETINDANAWLTNVWRGIRMAPSLTALFCDWPVSELDLHSRGDAIFYRQPEIRELGDALRLCKRCRFCNDCPMKSGTPESFIEWCRSNAGHVCPAAAGIWIWGVCAWIGGNWGYKSHNCKRDEDGNPITVTNSLPHLGNRGQGVNRKRPHLGGRGQGVNRQRPHLGGRGQGVNRQRPHLGGRGKHIRHYFSQLARRLRDVRICCGDWKRVVGDWPTIKLGLTAIFFDPPYGCTDRDSVYGDQESFAVAADVRQWCIEHGNNLLLRIALCGYDTEGHAELLDHGWTEWAWKTGGGYSNQNSRGNKNATRERVYFSPHCIGSDSDRFPLFSNLEATDAKGGL